MKRGLIVGLTGGVACGKTTVSNMLREMGAYIIDADKIGHEMLRKDSPVYDRIVMEFGDGILDQSGDISRPKLAGIVFRDPSKLMRLNRIVHPEIARISLERARKFAFDHPQSIVVIDAALLFEFGIHDEMDFVVVVWASRGKQIERQLARWREMGRNPDESEARARIDAQMPMEKKIEMADYAIENNGSVDELRRKVADLWVCLTAMQKEM